MIDMTAQPFEILLVEDEPADVHLVRLALREGRVLCNLRHAADGIEALELLRQRDGADAMPRPDLILLDLNMPRMNGREFLAEMKADPALTSIPVVVLTTSDVERDIVASYRLGAAGYITKPVDMDQFCDVIRQLEAYWFALVRLPRER